MAWRGLFGEPGRLELWSILKRLIVSVVNVVLRRWIGYSFGGYCSGVGILGRFNCSVVDRLVRLITVYTRPATNMGLR